MDTDLERRTLANTLLGTHLFTGTSDLDKLTSKQMIFLVALGLKPLAEVYSAKLVEADGVSKPVYDDPAEIKTFLDSLGLKSHIINGQDFTTILIAKDSQNIDKYTDKSENIGLIFGYPASAVEAFDKNQSMDIEHQERLEEEAGLESGFTAFRFSKDNYQEELKVLKGWYDALHEYDLI